MSETSEHPQRRSATTTAGASLDYLAAGRDYNRPHLDRAMPSRGIVIDVGCGYGRVPALYNNAYRTVIGVEIEHSLVRAMREVSCAPGLVGVAQALPLPSGTVDCYIGLGTVGVVEPDPDPVLREARRVLRPGGVLYLSITFAPRLRRPPKTWRMYPITSFSEAEAKALLERHGFTVELTRRTSLAWGLGPFRFLARLFPAALLREDERTLSYRLLAPLTRPFANLLLVIARG